MMLPPMTQCRSLVDRWCVRRSPSLCRSCQNTRRPSAHIRISSFGQSSWRMRATSTWDYGPARYKGVKTVRHAHGIIHPKSMNLHTHLPRQGLRSMDNSNENRRCLRAQHHIGTLQASKKSYPHTFLPHRPSDQNKQCERRPSSLPEIPPEPFHHTHSPIPLVVQPATTPEERDQRMAQRR